MKPALEYLPRNSGESFVIKYFDYPYFPTPWHFHPEYEIVLVTESTGKRFIGDQVSDFKPGDLVLLGPYLPHTYQNDPQYLKKCTELKARSIVVHFREDSFGDNFFMLPETRRIYALLNRSFKGLSITGNTNKIISSKLYDLLEAKEFSRWLILLEILNILSLSEDLQYICNGIITAKNDTETTRMNIIIDFVIKNFTREITIPEISGMVSMTQNSFSRYFSYRTRKSFTAFVNEVRLNQASKLLIETSKSVTEVCLESGFNNLSNFNRQFRTMYNNNPLTFRKLYQSQNI